MYSLLLLLFVCSAHCQWTREPSMLHSRYGMAAATVGPDLYLMGGSSSPHPASMIATSTVEKYTVESANEPAWSEVEPMLTARASASAQVVDGKIFAVGGSLKAGVASSAVELYDPVLNTWTKLPGLSVARSSLGTAVVAGKLYALGGFNSIGQPSPVVEVYDVATGQWSKIKEMPARAGFTVAVSANNDIVVFGGVALSDKGDLYITQDVLQWNPLANEQQAWQKISETPVAVTQADMVNFGDTMVLVGGLLAKGYAASDRIDLFNFKTSTWESSNSLPVGLVGLSALKVNNKIVAVGGYIPDKNVAVQNSGLTRAAQGHTFSLAMDNVETTVATVRVEAAVATTETEKTSEEGSSILGISFGSIMVVAMVALAAYFIAGAAWRSRQGYSGMDTIPNQEFWTATLPSAAGSACGKAVEVGGKVARVSSSAVGKVGRKYEKLANSESPTEMEQLEDPFPSTSTFGRANPWTSPSYGSVF